jgi:hypothetical protein
VYLGENIYQSPKSRITTVLSDVRKLRRTKKYTSRIVSNVQIRDEQFCINAIEAPILISR